MLFKLSPTTMEDHQKPTFLDRLSNLLSREPETRPELLDVLRGAYERRLIDDDALSMIQGALQVSDMNVEEIMIPRGQVSMIDVNATVEEILPELIENGHSRFPVYDGNRDQIIGILLAKDLLKIFSEQANHIRELLRPAVFIPESKRLNVLLRDFRMNRNHMAIVVDEYGGVAGIVTIEDVLEQIVGDIEDEYDYDEGAEDLIVVCPDNSRRVSAKIEIDAFNQAFGTRFSDEDADTLGGFLTQRFGHVPQRGETIDIDHLQFEVIRADPRRLLTVLVTRMEETSASRSI